MARIRTIKPDFFRHEKLFEAESETGLPLRIAFAGLWTAADREGRFRWSPRALKLDCLPYDDVDFSRVLDALTTRGFIIRYSVDGAEYGVIPSWQHHQVVNNREAASEIPEPNENNMLTRESLVPDASNTPLVQDQGEGKGRERKGKDISTRRHASCEHERFDEFWQAYPRRGGPNPRNPASERFSSLVRSGVDPQMLIDAVKSYAEQERIRGKIGTEFIPQAKTWLNQQRWSDHAAVAMLQSLAAAENLSRKVHVKADTPQWEAWSRHLGKPPPQDKDFGWYFDSEWPPSIPKEPSTHHEGRA